MWLDDPEEDYQKAVSIMLEDRRPSTSYLQRKMEIGYNKAARLMERMEKEGIVSEPDALCKRHVLKPSNQEVVGVEK